jgi:hypothetical protein
MSKVEEDEDSIPTPVFKKRKQKQRKQFRCSQLVDEASKVQGDKFLICLLTNGYCI